MIIEVKKFKDVNRAPYNPRVELKVGMPEYEKLKKSIETFGHVLPMVYNSRSGTLVGGHQTMTVLEDLGKTEAEMSIVDLGEVEEKALNIGLNKLGGMWNKDKLTTLLYELIEIPEFDIDVTGFDLDEVVGEVEEKDIVPFTLDDFEFEEIKEPCWFVIRGDLDDYEEIKKHITKLKNDVIIEGSLDGQLKQ